MSAPLQLEVRFKEAYHFLMDKVNQNTNTPKTTPPTAGDISNLTEAIEIGAVAICDAIEKAAETIATAIHRKDIK